MLFQGKGRVRGRARIKSIRQVAALQGLAERVVIAIRGLAGRAIPELWKANKVVGLDAAGAQVVLLLHVLTLLHLIARVAIILSFVRHPSSGYSAATLLLRALPARFGAASRATNLCNTSLGRQGWNDSMLRCATVIHI